ncbi:hypothetical protein A2U01_0084751, partial [Trifolium medium]|nr:hypothetical protein [Trifolium medium]
MDNCFTLTRAGDLQPPSLSNNPDGFRPPPLMSRTPTVFNRRCMFYRLSEIYFP